MRATVPHWPNTSSRLALAASSPSVFGGGGGGAGQGADVGQTSCVGCVDTCILQVCPAFPADVYTTLSNPGCVAAVMGHSAQAALANTLFHRKVRRSELLELPWV
jgi:hypothetical protein